MIKSEHEGAIVETIFFFGAVFYFWLNPSIWYCIGHENTLNHLHPAAPTSILCPVFMKVNTYVALS